MDLLMHLLSNDHGEWQLILMALSQEQSFLQRCQLCWRLLVCSHKKEEG